MVLAFHDGDFHEHFYVIDDVETGTAGIIALHSTALGPAMGGCRFWHYENRHSWITDALRLAKGMSYKNALADLPFGGGVAVLQRPEEDFDRRAAFGVLGEAVAALKGEYITAGGVGTTKADMREARRRTPFVAGPQTGARMAGGAPSLFTAQGLFESMKAAARHALNLDIKDATVAVQGVGHVGGSLCRLLQKEGATLIIADIDENRAEALADELGARCVGADEILAVESDVLAPCALGGILNPQTIPALRTRLICGGANNQLASEADGQALFDRGILYAPDYVVNAGGVIKISADYLGERTHQIRSRVDQIPGRLLSIFDCAADEHLPPGAIADRLAQQLIATAKKREAA